MCAQLNTESVTNLAWEVGTPEIPGAVVSSCQMPEEVALHQLHHHPDVLLLEGDPKELDNVLVATAAQDGDLFQQHLLFPLPHIPFEDLHGHLVDFCQHPSVHLCVRNSILSQRIVVCAPRKAHSWTRWGMQQAVSRHHSLYALAELQSNLSQCAEVLLLLS